MECPSSPVYNTSVEQKRHAQSVAKRQRMGMPKLRELLRQKCRIRIASARQAYLDGKRSIQLSELSEILRSELNELDQDLILEQQVYEELLNDMNEWYAMDLQNLESYAAEAEPNSIQPNVLCPVCLVKPLQRVKFMYQCTCGVRFEHAADLRQFPKLLQAKIDEHELKCTQALRFFTEPSSNHLYAMCGSCDYFCNI